MRTALALLAAVALASPAVADPLLDSAAPLRWRADLMPETGDAPATPAYFDAADTARALLHAGQYKRALYALGDDADPVLKAEILGKLGRFDEARRLVGAGDDPAARFVAAKLRYDAGDYAAARLAFERNLADADNATPQDHYWLGRACEAAGDLDAAKARYGWFVERKFLQRWASDPDARVFESAETVTTIASALDRYATLAGEYKTDPSLHNAILGMFVRAYDVIDRDYWPAHLAAARFAHARGDREGVQEELKAVFKANPNDADALELFGRMSLDGWDFAKAGAVATALRAVDRDSRAADLLDAENLLLQRQPEKATAFVERQLARRPDDLEATGLRAATAAVAFDADAAAAALAEADKLAPGDATALFAVGKQLSTLRQYAAAETALRRAVDRAPWWTAPRNALGLLLTQSGDEAGAIGVLTAAREYDPFNPESANYLDLLRELKGYDTIETADFVIEYDRASDPLTAELLAEYLDAMGQDVERIYRWKPPVKTRIEVFPTHDRFSVRVGGEPYIDTVAACTGSVIAMVTPRDGGEALGPFDWAQVIRHEFTHTITLGATGNRIPHWMTEGLAVREEQAPVRQEWLDLLSTAFNDDGLFPLDGLTWGFVRPRKPTDRSLAYAQSWFVCQYVVERWGEEKLQAMLPEFAAGGREAAVWRDVLGIELPQFDRDFHEWMRGQVASWGRLPEQKEAYVTAAKEGEAALKSRDYPAAVAAFEAARKARPLDELPMRRLAGLYLTPEARDEARALELLVALHDRTVKDNRFAKTAARLLLDRGEAGRAKELAYQAVQIAPYDNAAEELLLETAEAAGDSELVVKQQRRLATLAAM